MDALRSYARVIVDLLPGGNAVVQRSRRRRLPPPPRYPPELAERLGRVSDDSAFITGNGFALRCRYVLNYDDFTVNEAQDNNWYFCKTDRLDWFFAHHAPRGRFVLFTHNSDEPVDDRFRGHLGRRKLRTWFAANVELRHPRLVPIPLGIANP